MRILVIDDHVLIREGVSAIIKSVDSRAIIGLADSCQHGLEAAGRAHWDLALLDLQLPDQPGFVALQHFRALYPEMPVVVVSGQEDSATVLRALDLGAKAFVPKSADSSRIKEAIETLLDGRLYLPENVMGSEPGAPSRHEGKSHPWTLTDRQYDVLVLLVAGLSNKLIARKLGIVESTVKIHVSAILKELKVASRTQAIIAVAKAGVRLG